LKPVLASYPDVMTKQNATSELETYNEYYHDHMIRQIPRSMNIPSVC